MAILKIKDENGIWQVVKDPSSSNIEKSVLFTEQNLTEEQKLQARSNIGAANEDQVIETVFGLGKYIEDLDFVYDPNTKTWNKNPVGVYWSDKDIELNTSA
jgi:hypothetical protein